MMNKEKISLIDVVTFLVDHRIKLKGSNMLENIGILTREKKKTYRNIKATIMPILTGVFRIALKNFK